MTEGKTVVSQDKAEASPRQEATDAQQVPANTQRLKFLVVTLVVAGAIGYLIFSGIRDTMGYYLTVSELIAQTPETAQESVRVSGKVSEGSVHWNPAERTLRFEIVDENNSTAEVIYTGNVPDSFKQGQKVIVEGVYADGVFQAAQLLTTCASKYE